MRTTVSIDDDVLKEIESIAEREGRTRRDVLNETLRYGIKALDRRSAGGAPYETKPRDLGRCLLPSLDDIGEALRR